MATQYLGDPDSFPASFEIPEDDDDLDAASVNVALEALGDRTAFLHNFVKIVGLPRFAKATGFHLIDVNFPTEILELSLGELQPGDVVMYEASVRAGSIHREGGWLGVGRDNWQTILEGTPVQLSIRDTTQPVQVILGQYVEQSTAPVTRKLVLLGWHEAALDDGALEVHGTAVLRATVYRSHVQEP